MVALSKDLRGPDRGDSFVVVVQTLLRTGHARPSIVEVARFFHAGRADPHPDCITIPRSHIDG